MHRSCAALCLIAMLSGCVTGRYTTVLAPAPNPDGKSQLILLDTASGKTWKSSDGSYRWISMDILDDEDDYLDLEARAEAHCKHLSLTELKQLIVATRLRGLDLGRDISQAQQKSYALSEVLDAFEEDDAEGKNFDHEDYRKAYRECLEIELRFMELSAMSEWLTVLVIAAEEAFEEKAMDLSSSP